MRTAEELGLIRWAATLQDIFTVKMGWDMVDRHDRTAGTATHYGYVEIPWFPASMPKLLSQHVYSALLVLDVSAPSEPGGH